jgi:hypothetical protein
VPPVGPGPVGVPGVGLEIVVVVVVVVVLVAVDGVLALVLVPLLAGADVWCELDAVDDPRDAVAACDCEVEVEVLELAPLARA